MVTGDADASSAWITAELDQARAVRRDGRRTLDLGGNVPVHAGQELWLRAVAAAMVINEDNE